MASATSNSKLDTGFVRQFVKPMLCIADACNTAEALQELNPRQIISIEFGPSNGNTKCDVRASSLEYPDFQSQADLVSALGLFEQSQAARALLSALHLVGLPVLCSVRLLTDDGVSDTSTLASFEDLCSEIGFSVVWRFLNESDAIYLLTPANQDTSDVTSVGYRSPSDSVTVLRPKRPALLVAGFFARSNCGDEALLQVIYEQFSPRFDIVISLDEHGATEGYWDLYPYDRCQRIHQGNLADPARSVVGMIVGGGGLPLGFVADQILAARSAGVPVALAGTDFPVSRIHNDDAAGVACREYLGLFDLIALRSSAAADQARSIGQLAVHGADWALKLATDANADVQPVADRALVVLREFPLAATSYYYIREITRLVDTLQRAGFRPTLLPFCMEDDRFASTLGLDLIAPSERHWWNARRVKQLIASSGLVISVGRLHPTIFAASTRTPVLQLCPPLSESMDVRSFPKISAMSNELNVDYLPTVASVANHLKQGLHRPSGSRELTAAQDRLDSMIVRLRALFNQEE
jgi:hypothetical protein